MSDSKLLYLNPREVGIKTKQDGEGDMYARVSDLIAWIANARDSKVDRAELVKNLRGLEKPPPGVA